MFAKELIQFNLPTARPKTTIKNALQLMEKAHVHFLPIVENNQCVGMLSETALNAAANDQLKVEAFVQGGKLISITENEHFYEVFRLMLKHKLAILPANDTKGRYLGCILQDTLLKTFSEISSLQEPGSIIVLEIPIRSYHLSEIAQIVESHNAAIMSLYLHTLPDSAIIEVTLKLNVLEIHDVLGSFERYNYKIKAYFAENGLDQDFYRGRYDSLMQYLNV
ncbi:MAG: CBS domain-containing protein [Chitinophagales bacterium]|nr:CBS domain-containing protein [Bacteroidota bacterium]MCB9043983.1 CBS domain-containing protein [Chitinophagales bacterium]